MEIDQFSLQEKIGLLLMIGVSGHHPDNIVEQQMKKNHVASYLLFQKNTPTPRVTKTLTQELNQTAEKYHLPKLLIAIDQEHGRVIRLKEGITRLPAAYALGRLNNPKFVYDTCYISGCELRSLGINVNFAPVADINSNPENPIIGTRSFGEQPDIVSKMVRHAIQGFRDAGILCSAKHFPGHGDVAIDSHLDLPVSEKSLEELYQMELTPFQTAISESVPIIMTAHILYPKIDSIWPATLSPMILTKLLREKLNYKGIIISDDLEMKALNRYGDHPDLAIQMINAGCDMLIISENLTHDISVDSVYQALLKAVQNNMISEKRLNESVQRLLDLRKQLSTENVNHPEIREPKHVETSHQIMKQIFLENQDASHFPVPIQSEHLVIISDIDEVLNICQKKQPSRMLLTDQSTAEEIVSFINHKREIFIFLCRTKYLSKLQEIEWSSQQNIRFFSLNNPYIQSKIKLPYISYINLYADCLPFEIFEEILVS
jgi:beta-N-acetylhexosaminidase